MNLTHLVSTAATRHGLFPAMVWGVVQVESSGNPWAWNPEPHYRYLWDLRRWSPFRSLTAQERQSEAPPRDFTAPRGVAADAEWWGQQASWGLMQVMGAVAREIGYAEPFLTGLCHPETGLEYGCRFLARQMRAYDGQAHLAVAAYNAGSPRRDPMTGLLINQGYVDKVTAAAARFGTEEPRP